MCQSERWMKIPFHWGQQKLEWVSNPLQQQTMLVLNAHVPV
jgi:hypothetical protein